MNKDDRALVDKSSREALRATLVDLYWEAMNLGTSNKALDTDEDGWTNESGFFYARGKALHDFARNHIKPALTAIGVNPFDRP